MTRDEEDAHRLTALEGMMSGLGFEVAAQQLRGFVLTTQRLPLGWLRIACSRLGGSWDQRFPPKPAHVIREAVYRAGFVAPRGHASVGEVDLARVRWWPPAGVKVPFAYAERWGEAPSELPPGAQRSGLLLPDGREHRPIEVLPSRGDAA